MQGRFLQRLSEKGYLGRACVDSIMFMKKDGWQQCVEKTASVSRPRQSWSSIVRPTD